MDDNRPFFFYTVQPRDLLNFLSGPTAQRRLQDQPRRSAAVRSDGDQHRGDHRHPSAAARGSRQQAAARTRRAQRFLLYFLCIGIGYILVQVALIQKFVMLLGHPTYALTVIIFSMLVSSGLGSFFSRQFVAADRCRATPRA